MARRLELFIRELSDGEAEHIHAFNGPITSSRVVTEDIVVVGSADGAIYAFDVPCGSDDGACRPRWTGATGGPVRPSPAVQDGVVYVGSDDGYLHAFAVDCGMEGAACEPLWRGWTGGVVRSSRRLGLRPSSRRLGLGIIRGWHRPSLELAVSDEAVRAPHCHPGGARGRARGLPGRTGLLHGGLSRRPFRGLR